MNVTLNYARETIKKVESVKSLLVLCDGSKWNTDRQFSFEGMSLKTAFVNVVNDSDGIEISLRFSFETPCSFCKVEINADDMPIDTLGQLCDLIIKGIRRKARGWQ